MKVRFNYHYFALALLLFVIEAFIGAYLHDAIIRPYGGDFLVVIFIYCVVKICFNIPVMPAAIGVLIFSYVVEVSQYFHLINYLGLAQSKAARLIMGTSFAWTDLLCYTLGMLTVLAIEYAVGNLKVNNAAPATGSAAANVIR